MGINSMFIVKEVHLIKKGKEVMQISLQTSQPFRFWRKISVFFIIYDFPPLSIIFRKNEIIDKCTCTCLQRKMAAYKLKLDSAGYDRI